MPDIYVGLQSFQFTGLSGYLSSNLTYGPAVKVDTISNSLTNFTLRVFRPSAPNNLQFVGVRYLIYDKASFIAKYPGALAMGNYSSVYVSGAFNAPTPITTDLNASNTTSGNYLSGVWLNYLSIRYTSICHTSDTNDKAFNLALSSTVSPSPFSFKITISSSVRIIGNCTTLPQM